MIKLDTNYCFLCPKYKQGCKTTAEVPCSRWEEIGLLIILLEQQCSDFSQDCIEWSCECQSDSNVGVCGILRDGLVTCHPSPADTEKMISKLVESIFRMKITLETQRQEKESICQSPIEQRMYDMLIRRYSDLTPQFEIGNGRYYIDLAIPSRKVAIECDGHEFHKTKEQRTHDAERERVLQGLGWTVVRFTGTEITRNIEKCVDDLIRIVEKQGAKIE